MTALPATADRNGSAFVRRWALLLALLLPAPLCSAQILVDQVPHAVAYRFFAGQLPRAVMSPPTGEEDAKFEQVYDAVLQGDAALDTEGDVLSAQMDAYRKKLIAAMAQIDPQITPLLERSGSPLTRAQSAEIRKAQAQAMQADPPLQSEWDDLKKKLAAHREAVDAAMMKMDPSIAPILAKFAP